MWPPTAALIAGPPPWKGAWTMSTFAASLNISPITWWVVPAPGVPYAIVPGFSRASATSSASVFAGTEGFTANTIGTEIVCPTALKSLSGSYLRFGFTDGLITKLGKVTSSVWPSPGERAPAS